MESIREHALSHSGCACSCSVIDPIRQALNFCAVVLRESCCPLVVYHAGRGWPCEHCVTFSGRFPFSLALTLSLALSFSLSLSTSLPLSLPPSLSLSLPLSLPLSLRCISVYICYVYIYIYIYRRRDGESEYLTFYLTHSSLNFKLFTHAFIRRARWMDR